MNSFTHHYRYSWSKKYKIAPLPNEPNRLCYIFDEATTPLAEIKEVICVEDAFDAIWKVHDNNGHTKARTLHIKCASLHSKSVTQAMCRKFSDRCPQCILASTKQKTQPGHTPIISKGFCARGQVDLIDYQYLEGYNHGFNWLLTYQDHGGKLIASNSREQQ
jgi:hypothetical protein